MTVASPTKLMTTEEFLALPDDGIERNLIRGVLYEGTMTTRNRWHSRVEPKISHLLMLWLSRQPEPRGGVYSGEVGCKLRRDPDTTVGIDVAYFSAEVVAREPKDTSLMDGPPILAVEILSPYDTQVEIDSKIEEYLAAGVPLVWIVDPRFKTVTVHRPDAEPEMFNIRREISGEPHLPGFRAAVADIFG